MNPERIGPYRVLDLLGRGGLGVVYRAWDERTADVVAVKLLTGAPSADPHVMRRFRREFEALAALDHPYVVRVFEAGLAGDMPYYAMELVEGVDIKRHVDLVVDPQARPPSFEELGTGEEEPEPEPSIAGSSRSSLAPRAFDLDAWVEEPDSDILMGRPKSPQASASVEVGATGPAPSVELPYATLALAPDPFEIPHEAILAVSNLNDPMRMARIREVMAQVCSALAYIHSRGLVHRDLKPSNILVDVDGDARLMDFGLVKTLAEYHEVTDSGHVVGTYRYMSPEQAAGEPLDARSDLYSLGVVLYELLAGRPPFLSRHPLDLWHELMETEPTPVQEFNPGVDRTLARLVHHLLRKDPHDRPQLAEDILDALMEG